MRDVLGKELAVGDDVVYTHGRFSDIHQGIVIGFTPQRVKVRSLLGWTGTKDPVRVVKVEIPDA